MNYELHLFLFTQLLSELMHDFTDIPEAVCNHVSLELLLVSVPVQTYV